MIRPGRGQCREVLLRSCEDGFQIRAIDLSPFQVIETNRHHFGLAVHPDRSEKLKSVRRWPFGFHVSRDTVKDDLRTKCVVEGIRAVSPCIQGAGNEFPEGFEVLKLGFVRIVVMRRRIVNIGRQPHDVGNVLGLDKAQ